MKIVDISLVLKCFSGFACMLVLLLMLCALAGAPLELKDGIIDSAWVLYAFLCSEVKFQVGPGGAIVNSTRVL